MKAFDQDLITVIAFDNLAVFKTVQGNEIMLLKISFYFMLLECAQIVVVLMILQRLFDEVHLMSKLEHRSR